jgi:phage terminase Nu1 subunit (DNA packaging protein)
MLKGNFVETAELLGISVEALRKAVDRRGCPIAKRPGKGGVAAEFNWPAVIAWLRRDIVSGRGDAALTAARTALAEAQAAKVARGNAHAAGDLVSIRLAGKLFGAAILMMRNLLLRLPAALAEELAGTAEPALCRAILDREIRHALEVIAEFDVQTLKGHGNG